MDDEVSKAKAQKKTNALFVLACSRGYLDDVKGLLDRGANITAADKQGVSALHFACGQGRLEVVKFLWSRGAELDGEDPGGNLPLHYAVIASKIDILGFLLGKGAWVEGSNEKDDTILHIAARKGQDQTVKLILEHGGKAILKDLNKRGLTPLGEAILGGHNTVASELLRAGASLAKASSNWPLLQLAVLLRMPAAITFLIDAGCNVNEASNQDGSTALHSAATLGDTDLVNKLLKAGADPAMADLSGKQASGYVTADNQALKKLLQTASPRRPASTSAKSPSGLTNDLEDFKHLDAAGKVRRLHKWADIEDPKQLERATLEFPLELNHQVAELRKLRQILNIQQTVVELLEDKDFQRLAQDPKARVVVEQVHADREAFKKFVDNKSVMDLLRALQRFQSVVRANGGHNVPFQSLLKDAEPDYQAKSLLRLKGMKMMLEARQRAAIAAALAGSEAEAKLSAERELDPARSPPSQLQKDQSERTQATEETGPYQRTGKTKADTPQPRNPQQEYERMLVEDLPPRRPWSWQKFRQEMVRALLQSTVMFIVAVAILKAVTGRYPWQLADNPLPADLAEPVQGGAQPNPEDYEF